MNLNLQQLVKQLSRQRDSAEIEYKRLDNALQALAESGNHHKRVLSQEARNRIAEAQRQRWAKGRGEAPKVKRKGNGGWAKFKTPAARRREVRRRMLARAA